MNNKHRLNLFAFPAETNTVFAMLILATVLLSSFMGYMLVALYGPDSLSAQNAPRQIGVIAFTAFLTIVIVFTFATFIYSRHANKIRKNKKIITITESDAEIKKAVFNLAQKAGIDTPQIEMPPKGSGGSSGQAFGFYKSYSIRLDDGLRSWQKLKFRTKSFNAVVLHEFAHIASGDIWRTYLADGILKSFIRLLIIPFVLGIIIFSGRKLFLFESFDAIAMMFVTTISLFFQFCFSIGIMTLIWVRLLRVREYYADWQASVWGAFEGLKYILQELLENEKPTSGFDWFKFHPSAKMRLNALDGRNDLFSTSRTTFFLAGVLLAFMLAGGFQIILTTFELILNPLQRLIDSSTDYVSLFLPAGAFAFVFFIQICVFVVPIGWLLSGTLGVQTQMQTVKDMSTSKYGVMAYIKLGIPALFFIVGIELGFLGAPFNIMTPYDSDISKWAVEALMNIFVFIPILFLSIWWYLCMMRFISMTVFVSQVGGRLSKWRTRFLAWVSNSWLLLFFAPGFLLSKIFFAEGQLFQGFLVWFGILILVSPICMLINWLIAKSLFGKGIKKCSICGTPTRKPDPALHICDHCGAPLSNWWFVKEIE